MSRNDRASSARYFASCIAAGVVIGASHAVWNASPAAQAHQLTVTDNRPLAAMALEIERRDGELLREEAGLLITREQREIPTVIVGTRKPNT